MSEEKAVVKQAAGTVTVQGQPANQLTLAIERGLDPATIGKLMDLQERYDAMQAKKAFVVAMAAFKAVCPPVIDKDKRVNVELRGGGTMRYQNASIGALITAVTPGLSANGLSVSWETKQEPNVVTVTCNVTHAAGHREAVTLSGPRDDSGGKNAIQTIGSSVTYLQRYTLVCALGLATADQDDADDRNARSPVSPPTVKGAAGLADKLAGQAAPALTVQGFIEEVKEEKRVGKPKKDADGKDIPGSGRPFTKYGIVLDGMIYGTFSETLADDARKAVGKPVTLAYTDDGKYRTAQSVTVDQETNGGEQTGQ